MLNCNYYEWLELSVENYEGDPAKLSAILEKKITEWNSSKSMTLQNRAAIHQTDMRTAIKDAGLWKNIYNEYKANVDNKIAESLEMCAENMKVLPENYTAIAKNQKVSVEYVKAIARKIDIPTEDITLDPISDFTLKDLEPDVRIKSQLDSIQKSINELGYSTLAELIEHETNTETDLYTITKDNALNALQEIKSRWSKKVSLYNKEKYQQKSHIDRICSGFMSFLKTYDIKDYISYLNWKSVNDILYTFGYQFSSLGLSAVNNKTLYRVINDIYSVIGNREKSKSVLIAFCEEKSLSYSKPSPDIAVCPFCAYEFEKKNPIQDSCTSCRKSFVVKCPKCGKNKNILVEESCEGIDLLQYPLLKNQGKKTQNLPNSLDCDTKVKCTLDAIQGCLVKIGFSDLSDFISYELNFPIDLSTASKDSIITALKDIKLRSSKTHYAKVYLKKVNIDRICSGMIYFLKNYEISDYLQYLQNKKILISR